jgi:hypothetical protein
MKRCNNCLENAFNGMYKKGVFVCSTCMENNVINFNAIKHIGVE